MDDRTLPEILNSKTMIESPGGVIAKIVVTKKKTEYGEKLYRLKYTRGNCTFTSTRLWSRDELAECGCILAKE